MVLTLVVKVHNYWLCLCAVSALCNYSFIIITIIFVFFLAKLHQEGVAVLFGTITFCHLSPLF